VEKYSAYHKKVYRLRYYIPISMLKQMAESDNSTLNYKAVDTLVFMAEDETTALRLIEEGGISILLMLARKYPLTRDFPIHERISAALALLTKLPEMREIILAKGWWVLISNWAIYYNKIIQVNTAQIYLNLCLDERIGENLVNLGIESRLRALADQPLPDVQTNVAKSISALLEKHFGNPGIFQYFP